jgi:hypothetical protein
VRLTGREAELDGHRIMSCGQCIHNLIPDAAPSPANEAIVAGHIGTKALRQIAPSRAGSQDPKDAVRDTAVVHPRHASGLFGRNGLMAADSKSVSSYRMIGHSYVGA